MKLAARPRIRLTGVLSVLMLVSSACHFDSMFKTGNTAWNCSDQGSSTPSVTSARFCRTDNSSLTYFVESSISSAGEVRIDSRMNNVYSPTDLSVTKQSSPSYSGGSATDIIFTQRNLPAGYLGLTWCDDAVDSSKCDQHYVAFGDDTPYSSVACHEAGHAIGLTHGAEASPTISNDDATNLGCMVTPNDGTMTLPTEITDQINSTY